MTFWKIWRNILTSTCSTSRLCGAHTLNLIINSQKNEQTVCMLTAGKISEENLNSLSMILFNNVIIGDRMQSLRLLKTDARIITYAPRLMGRRRYFTQTRIKQSSANLESLAQKLIVHSITMRMKEETLCQKGSFFNQNQEDIISKKTCLWHDSFRTITNFL